MSKKMKAPKKIPPPGIPVTNGNSDTKAPTINVAQAETFKMVASVANAPQLNPPEREEGVTAYEASVWSTDKRVNALYTTLHARNSWMNIAGIGGKKLTIANDSACEAMTQLAAHCTEKTAG